MTQVNLASVAKKTTLNNTDRMAVWPEVVTDDSDLEHTTIADVVTKVNTDIAANYVPLTPVDAKGDLLIGTANNTVGVLSLGTNNHVLTADSAQATGVKWAAAPGDSTKVPLSTVTTKGDLIVGTGSAAVSRLAVGATNGHALVVDSSTGTGLAWQAITTSSVGVTIYGNTQQSVPNATNYNFVWDGTTGVEVIDTNGFHSNTVNPERLTVPAGLGGYYLVAASVEWNSSTSGLRQIRFDGVSTPIGFVYPGANMVMRSIPSGSFYMQISSVIPLNAGDYVQLVGYQDSGSALLAGTSNTWFQMWRL